jgi:cysteinyl-tRNA synthetase
MRLYDTQTRKLQSLPAPPARIGIYTCGPTVYQRIHVGNARPYVISLWLKRYLAARGYEVTLVENVTDVNDKIYAAAPGASAALARAATDWYVEDTNRLGLGRPDFEPLASETVSEIIAMIETLIASGHAYTSNGDIYFAVSTAGAYGQLSGQRPDEVEQGEGDDTLKRDAKDFALWKAAKPDEDTSWEAPWGRGRPGWHIECSAMAAKFLGPSFDIHLGGLDLVFPHHENELAQSRALGHDFARIWMHNGIMRLGGEKMAKSTGNIATLRDILDEHGAEVFLLFLMSGHWSKPLDFTAGSLAQARAQADGFRDFFLTKAPQGTADLEPLYAILDEDLNTPAALALFHEWRSRGDSASLAAGLELFGLGALTVTREASKEALALAEARRAARAAKDFVAADRLRAELDVLGYEVRDVTDPSGQPSFQLVPRS